MIFYSSTNTLALTGNWTDLTPTFKRVQAVLTGGGMVRVSAALDFDALPAPTTDAQFYEVYRFDDALQASAPVFVEVGYRYAQGGSMGLSVRIGNDYVGGALQNPSARRWTASPQNSLGLASVAMVSDAHGFTVNLSYGNPYWISVTVTRLFDPLSGAPCPPVMTSMAFQGGYGMASENYNFSFYTDTRLGLEAKGALNFLSVPSPSRSASNIAAMVAGPTVTAFGRLYTLVSPRALYVALGTDVSGPGGSYSLTLFGQTRSFVVVPGVNAQQGPLVNGAVNVAYRSN